MVDGEHLYDPAATFRHRPWDGSHPLFRIGLHRLDLANWIEADDRLVHYLDEKERLHQQMPDTVFAEEPDSRDGQQEVLEVLVDHLTSRFPEVWRQEDSCMEVAGRSVRLDSEASPLRIAAGLVAEDLLLLRRDMEGWRLVAGSLCFPSSWSLVEKMGKRLDHIHAPVPAFGPGSRMALMMARIFDNLKVDEPTWRMNWSLYADDALFHGDRVYDHARKRGQLGLNAFLRVEYQTLRRLPVTGDILFTVGIHLDPVKALASHPDRAGLAAGLTTSLLALDTGQLSYKGLKDDRDQLIEAMRAMVDA